MESRGVDIRGSSEIDRSGALPRLFRGLMSGVSKDLSVMFSAHKTNLLNAACVVVLIRGNRRFDLNLEH